MDKLTDIEQKEMFESVWSGYSKKESFFKSHYNVILSIAAVLFMSLAFILFNSNSTNKDSEESIIITTLEDSFWQDQYSNEEELLASFNDSDIDAILLTMN